MSTVDTNAAATAPVAAPKEPSKMEKARVLFNTIAGETLAEGDSARKQFISRGQSEIGLTKAGAITYYNNLRNEAKGGKLYAYGAKKAAPAQAETTAGGEAEANAQAGGEPVGDVQEEQQAAE